MKNKRIFLLLLLTLGFCLRLYRLNAPLLDWHSWRQADTAAVARNFLKTGFNLLIPKFDDLSNIPSGKENPEGYRFVEFPVYNALHAAFFRLTTALFKNFSFEAAGRVVSIFASLGSALFLYLIVELLLGSGPAFVSAAFFLFLPYNIYYSRTILPEPAMVMFSLAGIYYLLNWQKTKKTPLLFLSASLAALAILVKPYAVFLLAPTGLVVFGELFFKERSKKGVVAKAFIYAIISCLPFVFWRLWMGKFPEGIPVNLWLLNQGGLRFRPAWWRWLFAERLGKLILGYWGIIFLGLGLITKVKGKEALFYSWLIGIFTYLSVFARGNIQHDYYQIIAIPVLSVFLAKGVWFLLKAPEKVFHRFSSFLLLALSFCFMFGFSWYHIRDYYQINRGEIVELGRLADKILPKDAKVIAPYGGDTVLLYQINRQGWPAITHPVSQLINLGASYYLTVDFDRTTDDLLQKCRVIEKNDKWVMIDLKECREELI
ncbi:MAG: glycosyltransferase family 39 protein [Patescibacteria group bacterium]